MHGILMRLYVFLFTFFWNERNNFAKAFIGEVLSQTSLFCDFFIQNM